jgi:hypothetical protein
MLGTKQLAGPCISVGKSDEGLWGYNFGDSVLFRKRLLLSLVVGHAPLPFSFTQGFVIRIRANGNY